ncbi:DUF433 domain-containing protein [Aureimonas sp. SK2]|uniref:DUF433 domain-containing protein n=1 Tax=Aureimonas sp. SK2 TaxID=3015992 RepID=UPI0024451796|nr:DUF433 domain-containing protein [Aureimonas sp. SK2]
MPEIFFTADHHFGHLNIIDHCKRPFSSVDEMTEELVARWNAVVGPHDDVWHLGDFACRMKPGALERVFRRLRGRKHLIVGNHDDKHVRRLPWSSEPKDRRHVKVPGEALPVVCDHYSMRAWPKSHYGAVHLYGHSHGALPGLGRSLDVGVDCWDFRPVTLEELRPTLERQFEEFERQREVARLFRERAARGDPSAALEILRRAPNVSPEPGDELRNLREGDYDQALEVGLRTKLFKQPADPLGYDTSDPAYLQRMAADALAGRGEEAAEAEANRVALLLGLRKTTVVMDPAVMGGEPHVSGTAVPARAVLEAIRDGQLDFEVRSAFPTLPEDGVDAVRAWADDRGE